MLLFEFCIFITWLSVSRKNIFQDLLSHPASLKIDLALASMIGARAWRQGLGGKGSAT